MSYFFNILPREIILFNFETSFVYHPSKVEPYQFLYKNLLRTLGVEVAKWTRHANMTLNVELVVTFIQLEGFPFISTL